MPADPETVRRVGDFDEQFRLRAYNAIHLATACTVRPTPGSHLHASTASVDRAASTLGLILVAR